MRYSAAATPTMLTPPSDRVELRVLAVPEIPFSALLAAVGNRLSNEEIDAARRFVSERHRVLYAISHAALRWLLAARLGCGEREIEIEKGEHGRPEIRDRRVRFNLSHTDGIAVIALTESADVGVDVECSGRRRDVARLAHAVFTPRESSSFRGDAETFFRAWTLKEAYAKARGAGLTLGFRNFGFELGSDPALQCDPEFDEPSEWSFRSWEPVQGCIAAAAVRSRHVEWDISAVDVMDVMRSA